MIMPDDEVERLGEEFMEVPAVLRRHNITFDVFVMSRRAGYSVAEISQHFARAYEKTRRRERR